MGIFLPEPSSALFTAHFRPVQQGTSIWTTVTLAMLFCWKISVSFWAYALASSNLGQPMMTRFPAMKSWKFLRATGAQSAAKSRSAFSKNGAFTGTRFSFMGHWGFCGVVMAWLAVGGNAVNLFFRCS